GRLIRQQLRAQRRERPRDRGDAERHLAERDRVAGTNAAFGHARAVDERPVARSEIAHANRETVARELGVAARDGWIENRKVAHRRASHDEVCTVLQLEGLVAGGARQAKRHDTEYVTGPGSGRLAAAAGRGPSVFAAIARGSYFVHASTASGFVRRAAAPLSSTRDEDQPWQHPSFHTTTGSSTPSRSAPAGATSWWRSTTR